MKYRITFTSRNKSKKYDVEADSSDEAFSKAYRMPEAKSREYDDVMVEEFPNEPSPIGIEFWYQDLMLKKKSCQYMIIFAEDEAQAVSFYNKKYKGKKFFQPWPHKIDEGGNCIYDEVRETYFAACTGYDDDATKEAS